MDTCPQLHNRVLREAVAVLRRMSSRRVFGTTLGCPYELLPPDVESRDTPIGPRLRTIPRLGSEPPTTMPAKDGFELQFRDIELLHYVFQLRLATIDHLSALSDRSVRTLWGRLLKLKEHRYLSSVARFMQKRVYAIGPEGVSVMVEHGYAPKDLRDKRLRHHELKDIGIQHSLFVADVHTRLLITTRTGPITLTHWQEDSALWDTVLIREGEPAIPIRPDAYFVLRHSGLPEGKNTFHIFLEADRSTMSHQRMATKIAGYVEYHQQGLHARKYPGMHSFIVATVTETRSRAAELRKDLLPLIPHASWRDAYLFIPFEDLTLAALLPKAAVGTSAAKPLDSPAGAPIL